MDPQLAFILQLLRQQQQSPAANSIAGLTTNTGANSLNNGQNASLGLQSGASLAPAQAGAQQAATPSAPQATFAQPAATGPAPAPPVTQTAMGGGLLGSMTPQQTTGMLGANPTGGLLGSAPGVLNNSSMFGSFGGVPTSQQQLFNFVNS